MNTQEHLLTILAEEAAEIVQDVSKTLRFGPLDRNVLNPTGPTNIERLGYELNDLMAVVSLLIEHGVVPKDWESWQQRKTKKEKVYKFLEYARNVGALE